MVWGGGQIGSDQERSLFAGKRLRGTQRVGLMVVAAMVEWMRERRVLLDMRRPPGVGGERLQAHPPATSNDPKNVVRSGRALPTTGGCMCRP